MKRRVLDCRKETAGIPCSYETQYVIFAEPIKSLLLESFLAERPANPSDDRVCIPMSNSKSIRGSFEKPSRTTGSSKLRILTVGACHSDFDVYVCTWALAKQIDCLV